MKQFPLFAIARMRDLIGHHDDKLDPQIVRATIGELVTVRGVGRCARLSTRTSSRPVAAGGRR